MVQMLIIIIKFVKRHVVKGLLDRRHADPLNPRPPALGCPRGAPAKEGDPSANSMPRRPAPAALPPPDDLRSCRCIRSFLPANPLPLVIKCPFDK